MGEPENERNRTMLREAVAPFTDEEILAIAWFNRGLSTGDSWRKGPRLIKRLLATGDHPADNTGNRNVLAVTPEHVLVFAGSARPPLVRVKKLIASWPLDRVHVETEHVKASVLMNATVNTYTARCLRATMTLDGDPRPLIMDFPKIPISRETVAALKAAATGS